MGTMTTLPRADGFTRADLDAMPDDGRRHELIDGAIIVTPAPAFRHQVAVGNLYVSLRSRCPADLYVLMAPFDVAMAPDTVVEPDLLVARRADFTEKDLPQAPLLAVEVLSQNTRRIDLTLKRSRYETAGTPSYWVVDPGVPSVTVWELEDGAYVERGQATGEEELLVTSPFELSFTPSALLA